MTIEDIRKANQAKLAKARKRRSSYLRTAMKNDRSEYERREIEHRAACADVSALVDRFNQIAYQKLQAHERLSERYDATLFELRRQIYDKQQDYYLRGIEVYIETNNNGSPVRVSECKRIPLIGIPSV